MSEHGVEFFERINFGFDFFEGDAHFVGQFFLGDGLVGYELVQRGVEQADGYAKAVHGFEDAFEVAALHGQELGQGHATAFFVGGENHFAYGLDAVAFEEHVLGAAQADALGSEAASLAGVAGRVGVGAYEGLGVFGCEVHNGAEVAAQFGIGSGHGAVVYFAGGAVERNPVTFVVLDTAHFDGLGVVVYVYFACA